MKDIDGYVTKDDLYRLISRIKYRFDIVVDNTTCNIIIEAISDMPKADVQPVDRWISVKDRLPEEQQCILAYEKDYGVMWGDYQGIKYSQPVWIVRKQGLIIRTTEVTHWQPLPEPPKDGEQQ